MVRGRPKEFDPELALEQAMHVFWAKGYEATSLSDLLDAMHLSKSSFYQTFESKHDLFQRCIDFYRRDVFSLFQNGYEEASSAREYLHHLFLSIPEEAKKGNSKYGCLIMNTASEIGQTDPVISEVIRDSLAQLEGFFCAIVARAQEEGFIPAEKDSRALARYLLVNLSGLKNMVKGGMSKQHLKQSVDVLLSTLEQ